MLASALVANRGFAWLKLTQHRLPPIVTGFSTAEVVPEGET